MHNPRQSNRVRLLPVVSLLLVCGVLLLGPLGCASDTGEADDGIAPNRSASLDAVTSDGRDWPRIVALGDSLTAGLGLSADEAYPARLQERLDAEGHRLRIVNAGTSGDTTAGGLRRLDFVLDGESEVRVLIVALGGNDGLRGLPVDQMRDNLARIIVSAQERGAQVLLAGMEAPPNFGLEYTSAFREVFNGLVADHDVVHVPFLLEGVAGVSELNQSDGIHPNAEGAERVAGHLWTFLRPMLQDAP
jgi:acyl-CoA thioesterase-1